ncbi:hypothetical protein [Blastococcus sp. CT_GayMR16]|uniref:hypothetical protein n=1 Tax=Blastococcus sp. CT_GayMR16 TaxID=2559607 RepID=UPI001073C9EC|nr:hypothetical protein [Blastococcus sp. CT_GayMR16]TFV87436.1 hypothetical protein E4P38_14160 [Blastococcus sp. CT_GayMR16]
MTTAEPNAEAPKRGRHAKRDDTDDQPVDESRDDEKSPDEDTAEEPREKSPEAEASDVSPDAEARDGDSGGADPHDDESAADEKPTDEKQAGAAREHKPSAATAVSAQPREEQPAEPTRKRSGHAIAHHPAGPSLLTAAALVIALALVPLLFDQLRFEVASRAADAARSAAAPWPAVSEPWFWPGWVATAAAIIGLVVLVVAAIGIRLPDVAVLVTAVVLAAATARAAWATFGVLNAGLWELIPVCIVCVIAFAAAVTAAFRWRSPDKDDSGTGAGEVAGVTIGAWLLVVLLLLGGSAIASSAETHAFGNVTSPPQDLAGLLSVRAADAPELDDLRGSWVPQVAAAQVDDDAGASAYAVVHHDWTTRFPTVLARGDDVGADDLDDTWWLSLVAQPVGSEAEAAAWCATNSVPNCTPRLIGD